MITELAPGPNEMLLPLDVTPGTVQSLVAGADGLADLEVDDFFAGMNAIMGIDEVALVAAPDIVIQPEQPPQYAPPPPPAGIRACRVRPRRSRSSSISRRCRSRCRRSSRRTTSTGCRRCSCSCASK